MRNAFAKPNRNAKRYADGYADRDAQWYAHCYADCNSDGDGYASTTPSHAKAAAYSASSADTSLRVG